MKRRSASVGRKEMPMKDEAPLPMTGTYFEDCYYSGSFLHQNIDIGCFLCLE